SRVLGDLYKSQGEAKGREVGRKEGRKEGREEGRKEGREETLIEMARNLKSMGMPVDLIIKATGLSAESINTL
ncbi:MAG: hypothetical protein K2F94_03855, partial [Muribaculaceae bacterium]|nr:hypothetical protein [Muribaculaceae bacterium]